MQLFVQKRRGVHFEIALLLVAFSLVGVVFLYWFLFIGP
jgi:hypothetical protein